MNRKIDRAIARTARKQRQAPPVELQQVQILVLPGAVQVPVGGRAPFRVMDGPAAAEHPWVLVFEPRFNAWRPVLLPPGTEWEIAPPGPPKPVIWTPQQ